MHRKYGDKGVTAVSVCLIVDKPLPEKVRTRVETFLKEQNATLANVLLNEDSKVWEERLKIDGPPCVYVFNRDNQHVVKLVGDQVNYSVIEAEVTKLLGK